MKYYREHRKVLLPTLIIFFLLTVFGSIGIGEGIKRAGGGLSNPLTVDLDTGGNDIKMGAGLIGYDGTASKGLQFDSGNEILTMLSGTIKTSNLFVGNGAVGFNVSSNAIYGSSLGAYLSRSAGSSTGPVHAFYNDTNTGTGRAAADQPCVIGGELEAQRWIPKADIDSDNNDVFLTGITDFAGLVLIRNITDRTSAIFRISLATIIDLSIDGDHTSTKDTAGHYNFYHEDGQFKLQNMVGDNKSISVAFWVLPL